MRRPEFATISDIYDEMTKGHFYFEYNDDVEELKDMILSGVSTICIYHTSDSRLNYHVVFGNAFCKAIKELSEDDSFEFQKRRIIAMTPVYLIKIEDSSEISLIKRNLELALH